MLSLLLIFLTSSAYGGVDNPTWTVSCNTASNSSDPIIITDYSAINSSMPDVNNVLNGGSSERISQIAEKNSTAIENAKSSAQAVQNAATDLAAKNQAAINAPISAPSPLLDVDDLIERAPKPGMIRLEDIANPDEASLPYRFEANAGEFRDEIVEQYKNLYKIEPKGFKRETARDIGLNSTQIADHAYSLGEVEDANFYKELGKTMLDIAVGLDPVTGLGRSTFELFTGRNLITGANLNGLERSFAFLGVMTFGASNSARAGVRMFHVFEGAGRLLREQAAVQTAIREGQVLGEKVGHLLPGIFKNHRITNIHTAEHVNQTFFGRWPETAPFQLATHVIEFVTQKESQWVRVHIGEQSQVGQFIMRRSAIEGLNPVQIAEKFALDGRLPTHVSDVFLPKGVSLFRGNIHGHGGEVEGAIQYWLKEKNASWFSNMRNL